MHSRHSRRSLSVIQTRLRARTAATATKLKPDPRLDRSESSQSSTTAYGASLSPLPNVSKWARPSEPPSFSWGISSQSSRLAAAASRDKRAYPNDQSRSRPTLTNDDRKQAPSTLPQSRWAQMKANKRSQVSPSKRFDRNDEDDWGMSRRRDTYNRGADRQSDYTSRPTSRSTEEDQSSRWSARSSQDRDNRYEGSSFPRDPSRRSIAPDNRYTWDKADKLSPRNTERTPLEDEVEQLEGSVDVKEALSFETDYREDRGLNRREKLKNRGSLISRAKRTDAEIPAKSKITMGVGSLTLLKGKKKKYKAPTTVRQDVFIPSTISVSNLSRLLNRRLDNFQRHMISAGMEAESYHDYVLSSDLACMLAEDLGYNPIINDEAAFDIYPPAAQLDMSHLPLRPPVVTIMGHVDHGKTTLLDTLRSSSVAKGEAGGITQHIGAFSVTVPGAVDLPDSSKTITFLDTPGHAAFSAMRSRGAQATDIIVLVVAADDGVMPQTREVIDLIKKDKANLGVVVAINKIDKPGVDIGLVQNALWKEGIELETMGGDVPSVEVSGLTGQGLDKLVETISTLAEIQDLRADRDGTVQGYVLESKVLKGLGSTATVLVQRGQLKLHSHIICGTTFARVKHLSDFAGKSITMAHPGMAVTVSGWKELPPAGEEVLQASESDIKKAVQNRKRKVALVSNIHDAEAINEQRRLERERKDADEQATLLGNTVPATSHKDAQTGPKKLSLVIKADVTGSVEALSAAVQGIGNKLAVAHVVSTGVGDVTDSDVMMAKAAEGMIVAFATNIPRSVRALADHNNVPCYSSPIIYQVLDEIKSCVVALLPTIKEQRVTGEATVMQLFDIQRARDKTLKIAGCRVSNGVIEKNRTARVVRNGDIIHEGLMQSLRYLRDDVTEVKKGSECGLSFESFHDFQPGDLIQLYKVTESPGHL